MAVVVRPERLGPCPMLRECDGEDVSAFSPSRIRVDLVVVEDQIHDSAGFVALLGQMLRLMDGARISEQHPAGLYVGQGVGDERSDHLVGYQFAGVYVAADLSAPWGASLRLFTAEVADGDGLKSG